MSTVIDTLIYDRTQADVDRVATQRNKILTNGWDSLSEEERTEWLAGMKGSYNATDLNRVTEAMKYLVERLSVFGYMVEYKPVFINHKVAVYAIDDAGSVIVVPEEQKDDVTGEIYTMMSAVVDHFDEWTDEVWIKNDTPTLSQMEQYLDNVQQVRAALELPQNTPSVPPDMDRLTIEEANDIEKVLLDIDKMLTNIAAAWFYSGEIYAGEFI